MMNRYGNNEISVIVDDIKDSQALKNFIDDSRTEIIKIPQAPKNQLCFEQVVDFLMNMKNFNWVYKGDIDIITGRFSRSLFGAIGDRYFKNQAHEMIKCFESIMRSIHEFFPGTYQFGLRNFFCPGDTFFHLDNASSGKAIRFLWAIGRPYGMKYTPYHNVKLDEYWNFIRRELYLIRKMDMEVYEKGLSLEEVWPHRPGETEMMKSGKQFYLKDQHQVFSIEPNWSSIHFLDTPDNKGTFHSNTFFNESAPGLQFLFTAYQ